MSVGRVGLAWKFNPIKGSLEGQVIRKVIGLRVGSPAKKKNFMACIEITPVTIITETSSYTLSHSVFLLESLTFCIQVVFLYLFSLAKQWGTDFRCSHRGPNFLELALRIPSKIIEYIAVRWVEDSKFWSKFCRWYCSQWGLRYLSRATCHHLEILDFGVVEDFSCWGFQDVEG